MCRVLAMRLPLDCAALATCHIHHICHFSHIHVLNSTQIFFWILARTYVNYSYQYLVTPHTYVYKIQLNLIKLNGMEWNGIIRVVSVLLAPKILLRLYKYLCHCNCNCIPLILFSLLIFITEIVLYLSIIIAQLQDDCHATLIFRCDIFIFNSDKFGLFSVKKRILLILTQIKIQAYINAYSMK